MKDNVVNFAQFRKKQKEVSSDAANFDLTLARQIVEKDQHLQHVIKHLGISIDEASAWLVLLSSFQAEIERVVYDYSHQTGFSAAFSGLLVQAMSQEVSDQLTSIGMQPNISKEVFMKFKKNSIAAILESKHLDDLMSDDFNNFEDKQDE